MLKSVHELREAQDYRYNLSFLSTEILICVNDLRVLFAGDAAGAMSWKTDVAVRTMLYVGPVC